MQTSTVTSNSRPAWPTDCPWFAYRNAATDLAALCGDGRMEDRTSGVAAVVVGAALAVVGLFEFVRPGLAAVPFEPFATGALVVAAGVVLAAAGGLATGAGGDPLALRAATMVGLGTLALAVVQSESLLFGGVFWLALVAAALVAAGAYRTWDLLGREAGGTESG